jgi:alpha-galactosidase
MTNRRKFLKSMARTAVLTGIPSAAYASTRELTGEGSSASTLRLEMDGTGLAFSTDGISLKGGRPSLTLLAGDDEKRMVVSPGQSVKKGNAHRATPFGPALDQWWEWRTADYRWRWTLSRLERLNGFTLRANFYNGSDRPVRLAEFNLCAAPDKSLTCEGDPQQWLLSPINGQLRVGHLGEILLPANHDNWAGFGGPRRRHFPPEYSSDGRWRIYEEVVTLYTKNGRRGIVIGPVGNPEANIRLDFKVEAGAMRLDLVSEMSAVVIDPGEARDSQEVLILAEPYRLALETLFRWWAATHGARLNRGPITGWCSWYDMLDKITGAHVEAVTKSIRAMKDQFRFQEIQIDMGYERAWGDWRPNQKFPDGWQRIIEKIKQAGSIPGIWLASLAVSSQAGEVYRQHADWFQRQAGAEVITEASDGKIIAQGPDERYLDPTHPGAQQFLREIIRQKRQEGFEYFKIDYNEINHDCRFHHPKKTRFQAFRELYQLYREEVGDSYLLACSEFTRAVLGSVDALRVGWDSRAFWDIKPGMPPICLLEALRCVGQSALSNGICWANDPDVTYMIPRDAINQAELKTWHGFVGLLGGTVMISEALNDPKYQATARMYEILVPPVPDKGWSHLGGTDRNHQQFGFLAHRPWGDFAVVQLYNVQDKPASRPLDLSPLESIGNQFHAWSFWEEKHLGIGDAGFRTSRLEPHGSIVLRLTPVAENPDIPVLVGSNLHIGMGSAEIENIASRPGEIVIELNDGGAREGAMFIHSRKPLKLVKAEGCSVQGIVSGGESIWKLPIASRTGKPIQRIHLKSQP